MKSVIVTLLCFFVLSTPAYADWRWATPEVKKPKPRFFCHTHECHKVAKHVARVKYRLKVARTHYAKIREWTRWTHRYIPACTWYGESGTGPKYARYRYVMPNFTGSGAYGKFQMMPGTYHSQAKYHDWSALDQEIAARREYWAHGTIPWANC